jgi:S-ribosylhomocysteine lyase
LHAIEHIGATFLRNHDIYDEKTVYFWPMGCRTGFYVIFKWELTWREVLPIIKELFDFIADFEWKIPWASPVECGNYLDMNLNMAKYESREYLKTLNNIKEENLNYPK